MWIILILAALDIVGRVLTLLYQMNHSSVRRLSYRTWVLLTGFVNFAFVLYWLLGCPRGRSTATCNRDINEQEK